jgi:DNA-binding FadR family transcriptional regulator
MLSIPRLKRETLAEQAAESLSQFIQTHGLQPGNTLPSQGELADQFGVSRTVIREAIQTLIGRGLIEVVNGKGAVIRPAHNESLSAYFQHSLLSKQAAILELMEVRRGLEVQAAILAAQRRTEPQLSKLNVLVLDMCQWLAMPEKYVEADLQLHLAIAEAAHNTMLLHMIESIRESAKVAIQTGLMRQTTDQERHRIQTEHEAVVRAISLHDISAAQAAMEHHFDKAVMALAKPL